MNTSIQPSNVLRRVRPESSCETDESGFTLIELMVVLLIMGILLAIAIPTFLGVTTTANDRGAQSNLTNALTEAAAVYQTTQTYNPSGTIATVMNASAPEFAWTTGSCSLTSVNCVSVDTGCAATSSPCDNEALLVTDYSKTGKCWSGLVYSVSPVTANSLTLHTTSTLVAGTYYAQAINSGGTCSASTAAASTGTWGSSYATAGTA